MNALAVRKKALVAESEANRHAMLDDVATLKAGLAAAAIRAKNWGAVAASATAFFGGLGMLAGGGALLKGAGIASSLWAVFRSLKGKTDSA